MEAKQQHTRQKQQSKKTICNKKKKMQTECNKSYNINRNNSKSIETNKQRTNDNINWATKKAKQKQNMK